MRFGNEYRLDVVRLTDIDKFADDLKVKPSLIRERAVNMIEAAGGVWDAVFRLPELPAHVGLSVKMRDGWDARVRRLLGVEA